MPDSGYLSTEIERTEQKANKRKVSVYGREDLLHTAYDRAAVGAESIEAAARRSHDN